MNRDFEKATETYSDNQIQVLEGLEAVRKRPGMYIGTTSVKGLHHLIYEIVDNSIDEALAGCCDDIRVYICKDGSIKVEDDGRGVPSGINEKLGLPTLEVIFATLHAGANSAPAAMPLPAASMEWGRRWLTPCRNGLKP